MLTQEEITLYLNRINGKPEVSLENLIVLHENHLMTFAFGSVTVQDNKLIPEDPQQFFNKIIRDQNCGVCYELNYNFHRLLKSLGFEVDLVQGQLYFSDPSLKDDERIIVPEFGHGLNIVTIDNKKYICEVGLFDCFRQPVELTEAIISQLDGEYEIKKSGNYYNVFRTRKNRVLLYRIDPTVRKISDFIKFVPFYNHDPTSWFLQQQYIYKKIANGHIVLCNDVFRLVDFRNPNKCIIQTELTPEQCKTILHDYFNLDVQQFQLPSRKYIPNKEWERLTVDL